MVGGEVQAGRGTEMAEPVDSYIFYGFEPLRRPLWIAKALNHRMNEARRGRFVGVDARARPWGADHT